MFKVLMSSRAANELRVVCEVIAARMSHWRPSHTVAHKRWPEILKTQAIIGPR